ncbi:LysR family transcriptional regulator [Sabulicella glaciei]|uniref:LysR substrate-binding domain-containing protein n=1 Tax=Sabulicella glaciei TaxID=2984948 RepID=A0ABT3NZJ4_9PROT|nr:LysR substrate-binding domain-containing protein [Roseococcus sp. MDT2-1-1]MCW8087587.1 LysR substrate-binding domain-containing protein [Roseococcus sp. MDT2-1-1]
MDLRGLRQFIAVVENGSFTAAAEKLRIAQPALSQQLRKLELELGCQLLQRLPRGVMPTPEGQRLLGHARDLLARAAAVRDELRGEAAAPIGDVTLHLPQSVAGLLTVPLLSAVLKEFPQVRLRVVESMTGYIPDWLRNGRIDLGMLFHAEAGRGLSLSRLLEEQLFLVGPADAAPEAGFLGVDGNGTVPFATLAKLPMILPGVPHGLRELIDQMARRHGMKLQAVAEVDALAQLTEAVAAGLGWTILSFTAIREALRAGRVQAWRIDRPAISRSVYLGRAADRPGTRAVIAVERLLRQVMTRIVQDGGWPAVLAPARCPETVIFRQAQRLDLGSGSK